MTPEYAAGFFDGEGCVYMGHNHGKRDGKKGRTFVRITVANTNRSVLEALAIHYGGGVRNKGRTKPRRKRDRQQMWQWTLCEQSSRAFLDSILPFSIVKREQIKLALEFLGFCDWRSTLGKITGSKYSKEHSRHIPFQRYTDEAFEKGLAYIPRMRSLNHPLTGMSVGGK